VHEELKEQGLFDGLAYGFEAGEVDDCGWLMLIEDLVQSGFVQQITLDER